MIQFFSKVIGKFAFLADETSANEKNRPPMKDSERLLKSFHRQLLFHWQLLDCGHV